MANLKENHDIIQKEKHELPKETNEVSVAEWGV